MTTTLTAEFNAAEFAELQAITADLFGAWFPAYEGIDPADLPVAARLAFNLDRLVTNVGDQYGRRLDIGENVQKRLTALIGAPLVDSYCRKRS